MSRPLIGHRNSWATFEKCALEVFILALKMMRSKTNLPIYEDCVNDDDSLNRRLSFCLLEAIGEWEKISNVEIVTTPKPNLCKQPDLDNEEVVNDYERAKPDFQWEFRDRLGNQSSRNLNFRNYDIECKRLGNDLASSRRLNKEYASKGILRFTISTHRYGQFTDSGMMIGYIQNSELQNILNEVNQATLAKTLPGLSLSLEGWQLDVSRLDHRLDRSDVEPTSFELRHLWVDLRHHYTQQSSIVEKKPPTRKRVAGKKTQSSSKNQ
jgi:hypothetical protein